MEQRKDWASIFSQGPFKDPPIHVSGKARTGTWGIPHGVTAYDGSNNTSLFSSSLPVFPHEKLNFAESLQSIRSIDESVAKGFGGGPHGDIESTAVGSFLPNEDELLTGMMDDLDLARFPSQMDELEEYDIFGNGGGMELDVDPQESLRIGISQLSILDGITANGISPYAFANGTATVAGEHPYGEHPSRTLFVRNINSNVEDSELKSLFEQYGDIRALYTPCKHRGFVMISYYDIRDARTAMRALQNKPLRRRKLDIHFSIPKDNPSERDVNQGTLVVFNLDASVSNDDLLLIFGAYGEVKEIRETPHKRHHKFIEFYDVRAADAALRALNRSDIAGKRIKVEPSRPGGTRRNLVQQLNQELEQEEARTFMHQVGSPITNSPPGAWAQFGSPAEHNSMHAFSKSPVLGPLSPVTTSHLSGLASILPPHISGSPKISPIGKDSGRFNHLNQIFEKSSPTTGFTYLNSQSVSELNLSPSPRHVSSLGESSSVSSGIATLSGPQFLWGSPPPYSEHATSSAWPTSSARPLSSAQGRQGFTYATRHGSLLSSQQTHHVGSAPSGFPLDRRSGFFPESPESSFMSSAALGASGLNRSMGNYMMGLGSQMNPSIGVTGNIENGSPNFRMMQIPRHGPMMLGNGSFPGIGLVGFDRTRRGDASGAQIDSKKQYQLDLEKIMNGDDTRTTLMIKNIPNKYTLKMLLAAIDETHCGTYDFLYLPIDFKNKCNVGYAFINMVSSSHIVSFFKTFNGKKWEKFNSEKVASLAYARIQGKAALVTHFQNSSLMNEDKRCRPIVFHSEGQELTEQEHLLSGNLNICIRRADGSYSCDSLDSPTDTFDE